MERVVSQVPIRRVTNPPKHHFFGYNDKCPWDATGRYLLTMETDFHDRLPAPGEVAKVGLVDLSGHGQFEPLATTSAWNFQQGAMLQWVGLAPDRLVIFNDRVEGQLVAVIIDIQSGQCTILPRAVYALSPNGRLALGVDFEWLHVARPGYGYSPVGPPPEPNYQKPHIYAVDLVSHDVRPLFSLADIISFEYHPVMRDAIHWVEHLIVNPASTRFLFLHRFWTKQGEMYTRLLTANLDGTGLRLLCAGMVSHLCWLNDREILAWARRRSLHLETTLRQLSAFALLRRVRSWLRKQTAGWIRQRIVRDSFLLINDPEATARPIATGLLDADHHVAPRPDGCWVVCDSYPDRYNYRSLLLFRFPAGPIKPVARFYSPPELKGPARCDLHSRWSPDGCFLCVDSAHEDNTRQVYVLDVAQLLHCNVVAP